LNSKGAKQPLWTPIPLGETGSPIHFTTPEGDKVKIWLSDRTDRKGEELYWRVNVADLKALGEKHCRFTGPRKATADIIRVEGSSHIPLTRLKPNPPAASNRTSGLDRGATRFGSTSKRRKSFKS
jgi:hypothetical protein